MSKYLIGRQPSSALTSPAESQAGTPEKPRQQPAELETPAKQTPEQPKPLEDTSPPRVSSCSSLQTVDDEPECVVLSAAFVKPCHGVPQL